MQEPKLLVAAIAAVLLSSCNASGPEPRDPAAPPVLLDDGTTLNGVAIEESTDGTWTFRRTPRSTAGASWMLDGAAAPGAERSGVVAERLLAAEAEPPGARPADGRPGGGVLRAGSTDDNADLDAFLRFLDRQAEIAALSGRWQPLDVRGATAIRVVDGDGAPRPGAVVRVVDEDGDRIAWRATTQGDGRAPFYPALAGDAATWLVEVESDGGVRRQHWDPATGPCTVTVPRTGAAAPAVTLDVAFVIDTTGSMGDEIERIKATLLAVTERLRSLGREFDLRYGAVLYRDLGDAYVTSAHAFTSDIAAFDLALQGITADGGGDGPESLNQGLAVAVDQLAWRPGAAHVAFLIADAPPHMDYDGDVTYGASLTGAVARGIRVHAVAASGLDEVGSIVFRQVAQFTRGTFVFVEYGGDVAASGAAHGVDGVTRSNNLDDILFERIRDEIAHWGRDADTASPR